MNSKMKRDSKDAMPNARHSHWEGGGNEPYPAGEEDHNQKKSERVSVASRFAKDKPGPTQPTRTVNGGLTRHGRPQSGGNLVVNQAVEDHNQKKAQHVTASQRGF